MTLSAQQEQAYQHLVQMVPMLVTACPDMRQMARETAVTILAKHGHPDLDPDHVFLNRFDTAQSSPYTFSGWQHYDVPSQSFTLPQLVMHRFDVHDQDNADLLSYLTGFYSDGVDKHVFDQHNEIAIEPRAVLEDFWKIDFCSQFQQRLERFWLQHADDYRTLAKVNFLGAVLEACQEDTASELAKRSLQVARALTGSADWPPTLEQLRQETIPATGYRLCTFDIGGHVASDILRVRMDDGYQLLYLPGEVDPLQLFASEEDLYWWVLNNTNQSDNRARFMGHFSLKSHADQGSCVGLNHMIDLLFFNWGSARHPCLNQLDTAIDGDAFTFLRDSTRQRMTSDAHLTLRSNSDLRKQLWIGYLAAFGQIAGAMAAVDWPVALAVIGAGLAQMGLHIDQAINGRSTTERKVGVIGAVIAAIGLLFDSLALASLASGGANELTAMHPDERLSAPAGIAQQEPPLASPEEIETWVPERDRLVQRNLLLEPFVSNVILEGAPGSGPLEHIYTQNGNFYALVDSIPYQVRRVAQLQTWVVIEHDNPYSFHRCVPLRWEAGRWHPVERPGLAGGQLARKWLKLWGRVSPGATIAPLPLSVYEVPVELRAELRQIALSGDLRPLSGSYGDLRPEFEETFDAFRRLRDKLATHASDYLQGTTPPARPSLPELTAQARPKQIIRAVYSRTSGLVIGESHPHLGSKQFLIDNMAQLRKVGVKVLYLEHFMTEFHQADLAQFNRTGQMPAALRKYVTEQDLGHFTDSTGRYTFAEVLTAAQREGLRLQAIDCMASYRQAWSDMPPVHARQQMMNYFAHLVIEADQAARGPCKWIALVGNSHANTFEGVLGISELQGAIGMRVEDIPLGQPGGIGPDPGLTAIENGLTLEHVRSDLRLQVPVASRDSTQPHLETKLCNKGDFTFRSVEGQPNLVHRSSDGSLKYTLVEEQDNRLLIRRPDWPWISGRPLRDLADLRSALERSGLHFKSS